MTELTKYGSQTNYKVPPESTGARIAHFEHWYFLVDGVTDALKASTGKFELLSSGIYGEIHSIEPYLSGHRILVTASINSATIGFQENETCRITNADASIQNAVLRQWDAVYLAETGVVDANRPNNHLRIDNLGAASVRFTEGEPQFDAYGLLRTMEPTRIADYVFRYSANSQNWQQKTVGTGTVTHLTQQSSIALDVGTAATDKVTYTTNRHHRYTPGMSHLATMSVQLGDTGKTGNQRRWGLFNDKNGLFFELDGTTLFAVVRSDATGTIVEDRIPQNLWTDDRVNGEGGDFNLSNLALDVSKQNVYWIDFQWHGAGIVRFGTFMPSGKRIVLHTVQHGNKNITPYMGTATLPIRVACQNSGTTASPSRIKLTGCAIFKEGRTTKDSESNNTNVRSYSSPTKAVDGTQFTCIGAFRAAGYINGIENRKAIIPTKLKYYCSGGSAYQVVISAGTVLDGTEAWEPAVPAPFVTPAEKSDNVVSVFNGLQASASYYNSGAAEQPVSESFNGLGNNLISMADSSPGIIYTTWVKLLDPVATGNFNLTIEWVEV